MQLYEYRCSHCKARFEQRKSVAERASHKCPKCGQMADKVFSIAHTHWGFTLSEASHHEGCHDELVSNRPSNEGLVRQ